MSLQTLRGDNQSVCTRRTISCWLLDAAKSCTTRRSDKSLRVYRWIHMQIFVSATEFCRRNKSHKFSLIWFCATCCCDKILLRRQRFSQKFSSTHEGICRCDLSSQHVAATCRLVCSDLNNPFCLLNLPAQYAGSCNIMLWWFISLVMLWRDVFGKKTSKNLKEDIIQKSPDQLELPTYSIELSPISLGLHPTFQSDNSNSLTRTKFPFPWSKLPVNSSSGSCNSTRMPFHWLFLLYNYSEN